MLNAAKYFLIVCTTFLFFACKKSKNNNTVPSPLSSTPSYSFSGVCSTQLYQLITGVSTTTSNGQQIAYFSSNNFDNFFLNPPSLNVGTVKLNGVAFRNYMNFYSDSTGAIFSSPLTWEISGGAINSFTFTNTNPYPAISGYTLWPDTISISSGFNISLAGSSNIDQLELILSDNDTTTVFNYAQSALSNYSYSPTKLTGIATNTTATLQIDLFNNNIQTIAGKQINFRNTTSYSKTFWVKN